MATDSHSSDLQASLISGIREIVRHWCSSIGASTMQTHQVIGLLDKRHLLRKSVKKGVKKRDTPRGLRFLFRHHSARILGWRERVPEGHPQGFSDDVNHAFGTCCGLTLEPNPVTADSALAVARPCSELLYLVLPLKCLTYTRVPR